MQRPLRVPKHIAGSCFGQTLLSPLHLYGRLQRAACNGKTIRDENSVYQPAYFGAFCSYMGPERLQSISYWSFD